MTSGVESRRAVRAALQAAHDRLEHAYCVAEAPIEAEERRLILEIVRDGLDAMDAIDRELEPRANARPVQPDVEYN